LEFDLIDTSWVADRIHSETLHQLELNECPEMLLRHVYEFVHQRLAMDGFCLTMAAVEFTSGRHEANFASAGHPPMLVPNGEIQLLDLLSGILWMSCGDSTVRLFSNAELASSNRLVLYTDGLTDVFNKRESLLGVEGLKRLVGQASKQPLTEMGRSVLSCISGKHSDPLVCCGYM
jgi:serine phosphatase RsbU (regulator of sigma subunit)